MSPTLPLSEVEGKFVRFWLRRELTGSEISALLRQAASVATGGGMGGAICVVEAALPSQAAALYVGLRDLAERWRRSDLRLALVCASASTMAECEYIAFLAVKNGVVARVFSDDASAADWVSRSGSAAQSAHDGNS